MRKIDDRTLTPVQRRKILERDEYICSYCFGDADQVDHIVPWCYLRRDDEDNLTATCWLCNIVAGGKVFDTLKEKREYIQKKRHTVIRKTPIAIWLREDLEDMGDRMREDIENRCIIVETFDELYIVKRQLMDMELRVLT